MKSYTLCLHQSHCKLEKRSRQMNEIIYLPPLDSCDFELGIVIVLAVSFDGILESARASQHEED